MFSYIIIILTLIWKVFFKKIDTKDFACEKETKNETETDTYWLYVY